MKVLKICLAALYGKQAESIQPRPYTLETKRKPEAARVKRTVCEWPDCTAEQIAQCECGWTL